MREGTLIIMFSLDLVSNVSSVYTSGHELISTAVASTLIRIYGYTYIIPASLEAGVSL